MRKVNVDEISGNIFIDGIMRRGTLRRDGDILVFTSDIKASSKLMGTVVPMAFNAHVHMGDSFISGEPPLNLMQAVGPGGFKHKKLESTSDREIMDGMIRSTSLMEATGTTGYCDFREGGLHGTEIALSFETKLKRYILGRPLNPDEVKSILRKADGISMSSVVDNDIELLHSSADECHRTGKIFGIHFSEAQREDIEIIESLKPNFLVHCLKCTSQDLKRISELKIPVVVTPRSNYFFSLKPDYRKFIDAGIDLMLGTDNAMTVDPDMYAEMQFLYLTRQISGKDPASAIMHMGCESWRQVFKRKNKKTDEFLFVKSQMLSPFDIIMHRSRYNFSRLTI